MHLAVMVKRPGKRKTAPKEGAVAKFVKLAQGANLRAR